MLRLPRVLLMAVSLGRAAIGLWLRLFSARTVSWVTVALLHLAIMSTIVFNRGLSGPGALGLVTFRW